MTMICSLYTIIQIINGVAVLFPGPRYMPLRVKCNQWRVGNLERTLAFLLRLSCQSIGLNLKTSRMNVFFSAIELLAVHCAQRSHHKSFPDPEIIPIIHLSKIHEMTTIESLRHVVKRFIDQSRTWSMCIRRGMRFLFHQMISNLLNHFFKFAF
uniref:Uncharacterized protein n=1 Tax=Populus trichocarpa TaxID=3694 RepID=A0A2K1YY69_POPTR